MPSTICRGLPIYPNVLFMFRARMYCSKPLFDPSLKLGQRSKNGTFFTSDKPQAPSTRIRINLKTQKYFYGYGFRPHVSGVFAHWNRINFKTLLCCSCVDGKTGTFWERWRHFLVPRFSQTTGFHHLRMLNHGFLRFDIVFAFMCGRQKWFGNDYVWTRNSLKTNKYLCVFKFIRIRVDGASDIYNPAWYIIGWLIEVPENVNCCPNKYIDSGLSLTCQWLVTILLFLFLNIKNIIVLECIDLSIWLYGDVQR